MDAPCVEDLNPSRNFHADFSIIGHIFDNYLRIPVPIGIEDNDHPGDSKAEILPQPEHSTRQSHTQTATVRKTSNAKIM